MVKVQKLLHKSFVNLTWGRKEAKQKRLFFHAFRYVACREGVSVSKHTFGVVGSESKGIFLYSNEESR
jgi:hypothetical protein